MPKVPPSPSWFRPRRTNIASFARAVFRECPMPADFSSQEYFRDPAAAIAKLRVQGPVIQVHFPIVGKVWTTTTQELADEVLKDSKTFTLRRDDGSVAGLQW